jgi:hypothetical protein
MNRRAANIFSVLLLPALSTAVAIPIFQGDNLGRKINGAAGGDTVIIGNGTYEAFQIQNLIFTKAAPLVIKATPGTSTML